MRTTTRRLARVTVFGGTSLALVAVAFACSLQSENPLEPNPVPANSQASKGSPAFFEFQVTRRAAPIPGSESPRYPDMLRSANVEGEVLAQFVVNADSSVDMGTFKVLRSTHDLFTASVRSALVQMRFEPALAGERPVRQLIQMPFGFTLSHSSETATVGEPLVSRGEGTTARFMGARPRRVQGEPQRVGENDTYFDYQVEKPVSPQPGNMPPRYPDAMRSANVEGEVLAQFVVDKSGMPDMTTFKVLKSTHELFSQAVEKALPQMKFHPADVGGQPVKQYVQMPFQFSLSKR